MDAPTQSSPPQDLLVTNSNESLLDLSAIPAIRAMTSISVVQNAENAPALKRISNNGSRSAVQSAQRKSSIG